jgi:ferritin-like protein
MTIDEFVDLLMSDLANEYAHMHFYMQAATNVRGLHRQELSEFFTEQAKSEMNHVDEFRKMIQGLITRRKLNKKVLNAVADFKKDLSCPKALLRAALEMEDKVVSNYVERKQQAEALSENLDLFDKVDGTYVGLFLEDQILDSRGDADNILEMLESAIDHP